MAASGSPSSTSTITSVTDHDGILRFGNTVDATWMITQPAMAYRIRTRTTLRRRNSFKSSPGEDLLVDLLNRFLRARIDNKDHGASATGLSMQRQSPATQLQTQSPAWELIARSLQQLRECRGMGADPLA